MDSGLTNRARKVLQCANQEAQRYYHMQIDTGHLLLGLLKEGHGVAAEVLQELGIDLSQTREEAQQHYRAETERFAFGKLPMSTSAKEAMAVAEDETRAHGCGECDTEHILLSLLRDEECVAARILVKMGLDLPEVRDAVLLALKNRDAREDLY